jgi:hypothetical protein
LAELRAAVLEYLAQIRASQAELLKRIEQTQNGGDEPGSSSDFVAN